MRILALYVSREFFKAFLFLLLAFVSIYTLFDFIEKVDNFTEAGVESSTMISFFMLQLPELISLLMPLAILLGTVITLGLMAKRNEITAIKSSGVSIMRFSLPLVLISILLAVLLAILNETVLPGTKAKTNYIWQVLVEKQPGQIIHKEKFWYKGKNSIYHIGFYDPASRTLSDMTYYQTDPEFNLTLRLDARRARFIGGKWHFFAGLKQVRGPDGEFIATTFEEMVLDVPERPEDFSRLSKPSEEMSLGELIRFIRAVEAEGYEGRRYRVDLMCKISFPFICVIMVLLGVPLALWKDKGAGLAGSVLVGLACALIFWVSFSYARSVFGYSGALPPVLAAWLPNVIFGLGAGVLFTHVRQ